MLKRSSMFSTLVRRLQSEVKPAHARLVPIFLREMTTSFNLQAAIEASDLGNPYSKFFEDTASLSDKIYLEVSKKPTVDTIALADKVLLDISKGVSDSVSLSDSITTAFTDAPTAADLAGWWRDYPGSLPWAGTASAGTSGSLSISNSTGTILSGTAENGHTPVLLDETQDSLGQFTNATLATMSGGRAVAYSGWALVKLGIDGGSVLFGTENSPGIFYQITVSGFTPGTMTIRVEHYTASGTSTSLVVTTTLAFNTYALIQWRYTGSAVQGRINGGAWQSVSQTTGAEPGTSSGIFHYSRIGFQNNTKNDITLLDLGVSKLSLTDSQFNGVLSYCRNRYNLPLT